MRTSTGITDTRRKRKARHAAAHGRALIHARRTHAPQCAPLGSVCGSNVHAPGLRARFALYPVRTQRGPRGPPLHAPSLRPHSRFRLLPFSLLNYAANAGHASPCFPQSGGQAAEGAASGLSQLFALPPLLAGTLHLSGGACACALGSSVRSGLWVLVMFSAGTQIRFVSPLVRRPAQSVPHPAGRDARSLVPPQFALLSLLFLAIASASASRSERVFCQETAAT